MENHGSENSHCAHCKSDDSKTNASAQHSLENDAKHEISSASGCCAMKKTESGKGGASTCGSCNSGASQSGISLALKLWISFFSLVLSFAISQHWVPWFGFPLSDPSWIALYFCAIPIFAAAIENLRNKKISSPLLISTAISGALLLQIIKIIFPEAADAAEDGHSHASYIFAAGEIAFLMALGEMIEARTIRKSRGGIEKLVSLNPQTATRALSGEVVLVSQINVGEILLVKPFDMIPVDGKIVSGESSVNQANLTGESIPVERRVGDRVLAGTWNGEGALEIEAEKISSETAMSKMIELVKEAEGKRAPISRLADKWAERIIPASIASAFLVGLLAKFAFGIDTIEAASRAVTILVAFCPCAFVLATPTAVAAALGNAAGKGVLIKSAAALERLSKVSVFAFDKTGTLTEGNLKVASFVNLSELSDSEILSLASSAESSSQHPIARAILSYAQLNGAVLQKPEKLKILRGEGVECEIEGMRVEVGKIGENENIEASARAAILSESEKGGTLACVKIDGKLSGVFTLSDAIRKEAKEALCALKKMGCSSVMLTGDNARAAERVALESGVDSFKHSLMPDGKLLEIESLKASGQVVCMVGDGVNDAPALAASDCSISMGALASEVAVESADIALASGNLKNVPAVRALAGKTISTIRANIIFSLSINAAVILLAVFGILTPVGGAIWHNLSSVCVVANSARLLKSKVFNKHAA